MLRRFRCLPISLSMNRTDESFHHGRWIDRTVAACLRAENAEKIIVLVVQYFFVVCLSIDRLIHYVRIILEARDNSILRVRC